uniref:(northern house mosquito) hypothetical protein n=1 Tax=Culex pipiens TaxID=7175 RepID=A0A8D8FAF1_CULPI
MDGTIAGCTRPDSDSAVTTLDSQLVASSKSDLAFAFGFALISLADRESAALGWSELWIVRDSPPSPLAESMTIGLVGAVCWFWRSLWLGAGFGTSTWLASQALCIFFSHTFACKCCWRCAIRVDVGFLSASICISATAVATL